MNAPAPAGSVKVVGPCKAGKTTLVTRLRALGIPARAAAQEHSGVPDTWQRFAPARHLVYLDVDVAAMKERSGRNDWTEEILAEQRRRLQHARQHADLVIDTVGIPADEVLRQVVAFLEARRNTEVAT
ncbi:MAG: hypothetical protein KDI12_09210 [Anaerolineae bacterium]|nr:hypothetical protein [Anaerolineae bacterium]MCB9132266.1 hypothetical protein [Anaerolineales bacterium]